MTSTNIHVLLQHFTANPPADDVMISEFEQISKLRLPHDYINFLKIMDGGEGSVGENAYLILWKISDILDLNNKYEVSKYVPHLVLIGSDGGGEAFAFDTIATPWPVVQVPFIGMDRALIQVLASDFTSFLQFLLNE